MTPFWVLDRRPSRRARGPRGTVAARVRPLFGRGPTPSYPPEPAWSLHDASLADQLMQEFAARYYQTTGELLP
ncbi:MAG: hypothetical protein MI919_35350 [Holophagales bacterium]|nr:hypothetical protein [Holophagales bacterium]